MLTAMLMIGSGAALAQTPSVATNTPLLARPNRPANVPEGYVVTPFGYFHQSCVRNLSSEEHQLADGRIQGADGSVEENVPACNYPRYTPAGLPLTVSTAMTRESQSNHTEATTLPEVDGWVENANITTGSASATYGAVIATWVVPPQPKADDGQVLFYFPGLEDINNVQSILQPVLQWAGGQWAVANWNCCLSNIVVESPLVNVNPGDEILGSIISTCPAGTLICATWNISSLDLSTGKSTTLRNTPSDGQWFNWAFGGVLEPYYVISCDDYPRNRQFKFGNVTVFDEYFHPITKPEWNTGFNSTMTPQCNYGVKAKPHDVTLEY
jgi:hypothetical protein